jgi:hypothetical protein
VNKDSTLNQDAALNTTSIVRATELSQYNINQLYNMLELGLINRAQYLAELDLRVDADGFLHF